MQLSMARQISRREEVLSGRTSKSTILCGSASGPIAGTSRSLCEKNPKDTNGTKRLKVDALRCRRENLEPLLIAHASLYVFANDYRIEPLKNLTASRVKNIVHNLEPCSCSWQAVIRFAEYVYSDASNLPKQGSENKLDYMKSVAMTWIVRLSSKGHYKRFLGFLEKGGQRATDFCLLTMAPDIHGSM
jgi:hypothetical protein